MAEYHLLRNEEVITDPKEIIRILTEGKYAIIGLSNHNEPYVITLSYGYNEKTNRLYFHCALKGQKLDFIRQNQNACATIIEDNGYIQNQCNHNYSSLIIRGNIRIVDTIDEKKVGLDVLLHHLELNPTPIKKRHISNDDSYKKVCILCLDINSITAKHH